MDIDSAGVALRLEATARAIYERRGPQAIHPGQWAVMRFLEKAHPGQRTVGGVAAVLGVTHAPASRAVAALARKKLVTITPSESDRRVREIELMPRGKALLAEDPIHRLTTAIESLGADEALRLESRLQELLESLSSSSCRDMPRSQI